MHRKTIRALLVLLLILLAVIAPVILSGYSELKKASTSDTYNEAAQHYQAAAVRLPWRADLYELSGHAYYHAQDYMSADEAYQKAFQHGVLSSEGWVAWGDVAYLNDDHQRAVKIWQEGLKQESPSEQLYLRLAGIFQEHRSFSSAIENLRTFISVYPNDASSHYRLGVLLTLSDSNRALSELLTASQLDPQLDPVVQTLRTALNLASINDSASERFVIIGRGLGLVNEWRMAVAAFEEAVKADEKNAEAWAWLGEALQQIGWAGEETRLDSALKLNPNSPIVRGLRGLYYQRAGNFRQALEEFEHAARLEPENPSWQVSLGETYSKLGDLIRALEAYQQATTLAPDDSNTWRLLAIFCGQNGVHLKDIGIPAAQQAVVLSKDNPVTEDVLGWLFLLDARYEDAEKHLTRALELDPKNASAHLHFAMMYLQKGDREEAHDHLVQARDLGDPESEVLLKQYFP